LLQFLKGLASGRRICSPNLADGRPVLENMNATVEMDAHTLELLEFNKIRDLLAGYTACSLGK